MTVIQGDNKSRPFPIVGIGASAGGIKAVKELLTNLPPDTGMSFVYVQHLDASQKSMLVQILSKDTRMEVVQATHLIHIEPNTVYIIPPNKNISIVDGVLALIPRKERPFINMPVDDFFYSLAERQQASAIGIILSGTAHDGTLGLKAIKSAGGITFAQDASADFEGMPGSAVAEGIVDKILSPKEIAEELTRISRQKDMLNLVLEEPTEDEPILTDAYLIKILHLLKKHTSVDFSHYKSNTIRRRIIRRMLLYKVDSLKNYAQYLTENPGEIQGIYQDLLIHVTSFFRDEDSVEFLKNTVFPQLLKAKDQDKGIRIWIPACSTGQEAYSMAILVTEVLAEKSLSIPIQIFATDLSETAIAKARRAIYSVNELANVSEKRLQRFFIKIDGHYRLTNAIRDTCVFAPHNLIKDPPFSQIDLISCCNLMIYLDNLLQKKILSTFYYSLCSYGFLVLGKSETVGGSANLFALVDKKHKIYSKRKDLPESLRFDTNFLALEPDASVRRNTGKSTAKISSGGLTIERLVDNLLLTKYVPGAVIIDDGFEVIQFRGSTSLFLEIPPGKASFNLLKLLRPGLAVQFRTVLLKVKKLNVPVTKTHIEISYNSLLHYVSLQVTPIQSESQEKYYLVVVEEEHTIRERKKVLPTKDKQVKQLQDELQAAKEDLRSFAEEQEASTERLQSANEEIISSNEELQSINEELETSKEEVESTNEELMTINNELQIRNDQLAEAYEYTEGVIETIREAVIVMDKNLTVRRANRNFYKIFQVREEETEGRLIYEIGNRQWDNPELRKLFQDILVNEAHFSEFEVKHDFPGIGLKIMKLNGKSIVQKVHQQKLVLLAIEDVTEQRKAEQIIREREAWFRNMADNAPVMMWVSSPNKLRTFFNTTWLEFTGRTIEEEQGNGWKENIHPDDREMAITTYNESFDRSESFTIEYRIRRADGDYRWITDRGKPNFAIDGEFTGYLGSCLEIHDKVLMNKHLEQRVAQRTKDLDDANKELKRSNHDLEQYAYVASHDLQEPLRKINTFIDRLYKSEELTPGIQAFTEKIDASSKRMSRLIEDLLNLSRTSRLNNKFFNTDLNVLLKELLVDFEVTIAKKRAAITISTLPTIQAIPLQMIQLFHNLISNALKFSKTNVPPVITITSRQISAPENNSFTLNPSLTYHEIIVQDNGIGFDKENAQQIFVIFQRLNNRLQFPGTGIGLALCRKIVYNHSGDIFAVSEEDRGAAFHVILPTNQAADQSEF